MEDKKKKKNPTKGAFGWFQGGLKNDKKETSGYMDVEKNIEVFNHNMGNDSNSSSEGNVSSAVAEAYEDIKNNPETVIEAMAALDEMEEEFISPEHLKTEYGKHVKGDQGDKWAYFKNKKWTMKQYEDEAARLQELEVNNKTVFGFENEDGSISKYFPKTPEKYYVVYRIKDGKKKTISLYSLRNDFEYLKKKGKDAEQYGPNQRDLELGEAIKLL